MRPFSLLNSSQEILGQPSQLLDFSTTGYCYLYSAVRVSSFLVQNICHENYCNCQQSNTISIMGY